MTPLTYPSGGNKGEGEWGEWGEWGEQGEWGEWGEVEIKYEEM